MKCTTYILVFLSYFQTGCFGNPVSEPEAINSNLWVFNYHGEINATNSADNETVSRWTVSGKLSVYNAERTAVFKLDDVKTSVFNGLQSELDHAKEKEIPEEAKIILQPFYVKRHDVENLLIHFLPNEPLWSQNFKRGLASNLDFQVDSKNLREAEKNPGASFKEMTLYGRCDVHYKASFDTEIVYERSFRHASCEKSPKKTLSNIYSHKYIKDYESKTVKTTTIQERNDTMVPHHMVSETHLEAKRFLPTHNSQYIDQRTQLDLLDFQEFHTEIPIDISKMTDKRELIYEIGDEPTSGRHIYNSSVAELIKQYLDNYDKFEKYFRHSPLQHIDISKHDAIENMFLALYRLDQHGLRQLEDSMQERDDNYDSLNMFYTFIPYIGTHASVKYLLTTIPDAEWAENEMICQRMMAVFPSFVTNYTDELLKELEPLINFHHFQQKSAKNAGVLSFASVLANAGKQGALSKENNIKFTKLYIQKFMESETYEERMAYLLGLINMDETFDLHLMNHIITNTTESKHIRSLALAGFKHLLVQYSDVTELYDMYWPIVENKREPFELRVGALDLLLSVNLSEEQFNTIIKKYSVHLNDPQDKHLANYLLTSLHSLQNTTHFKDYLGDKASEALKNIHIPSMGTFSTGNYRLAHTDNNIGAYLQARVISDPSTNIINSVQVNYKSFGFSYEFNGYSLYLNIDGLFDSIYTNDFLKILQMAENITSVPELLAVLKENHFELQSIFEEKDCNIDLVVFKDNTAVYAVHYDKFERFHSLQLAQDFEQLWAITLFIQFPLVNDMEMPSDLGTPLQFSNVVGDITSYHPNKRTKHINYRSIWSYYSWIESYNPFVDTKIASYKYIGIEKAIDVYLTPDSKYWSWLNQEDSFVMYTDNIIGTSVEDENILKQYCEKCEAYIDMLPEYTCGNRIKNFEAFGFKINETQEANSIDNCMLSVPDSAIEYFQNEDYKSNIDALPIAGPIMYLIHVYNNKILLNDEISHSSYHSLPLFDEDTQTLIAVDLDLNFKPTTLNPIERKVINFTIEVQNTIINNTEISTSWKADYKLVSDPEYTDKTDKKHFAYFVTFNLKYVAPEDDWYKSFKVSAERELFFPNITSDKYSLNPLESATGKLVWTLCKNLEEDNGTCIPNRVFTVTDILSTLDKAEKLKIKQNKEDYDECVENSKDLDFIAPTSACRRISARLAGYDNYKSYLKVEIYPKEEGDEMKIIEYKTPIIAHSRDGNDYIKLVLEKDQEMDDVEDYSYHKTIYYPVIFNPLATTHLDSNSAIPFIATTKCTIAPSSIEQFSGKFIPNEKNEWLAFAEGYNVTTKGLTGHTIDKQHVGFTYRSFDTVFTATVKEGKLHVEMDGKGLHKSFAPEDSEYKVYFLADNVINIVDKKVNIYYNTEYVQVTVNALYSKLLYGVCTKDQ